jgi:hypothetical protein
MLTKYQTQTLQLLQSPYTAAASLYATSDITAFVNTARGQIAGEGEAIRVYGSLNLNTGVRVYPFANIDVTGTAGTAGVFNIRSAALSTGSPSTGQVLLTPRSFPYFWTYCLNNAVAVSGVPTTYAIFGQGETGSFYVDPVPSSTVVNPSARFDCVCVPVDLASDSDPEALPYPWTDCVPYFAAYLALLSAQRTADADHMFQLYQTFAQRARQMSNGSVVPSQYPQQGNPVRAGQLGAQQGGGQ